MITSRIKWILGGVIILALIGTHGYAINVGKKIERSNQLTAREKAQARFDRLLAEARREGRERVKVAEKAAQDAEKKYKRRVIEIVKSSPDTGQILATDINPDLSTVLWPD